MTIANPNLAPAAPDSVRELGPSTIHLFVPMHRETALRCMRAGALLSTRELLGDPALKVLGDPALVRARLNAPMPAPWVGRLADNVAFSFTPRNSAAYGSCGPRPPEGAERLAADDLVAAAMPLEALSRSGLRSTFVDRLPTRRDASFLSAVDPGMLPWETIRASSFGLGVEAEARARYNAEVLVWGSVPLDIGVRLAVASASAAEGLADEARRLGLDGPLVRPGWFFGAVARPAQPRAEA